MQLTDILHDFESSSVGVAAITVDSNAESAELARDESIKVPLLSDPELSVTMAYGLAVEGGDIPVPATLIIDQDKTIQWKYVGEDLADRPSSEEILRHAESFR